MTSLRFSKITRRMWDDERFRRLSPAPPNGQTLFVRLLTGPELGPMPGLFVAGEAALAEAMGWPLEGFREAFREVSREGLAKADWKARLVWVPKAIKHNSPASPNVVTGWRKAYDELPDSPLKREAILAAKEHILTLHEGFQKAFQKAFPEAFGETSPIQEQEQEQDVVVARAAARDPLPLSESPELPFERARLAVLQCWAQEFQKYTKNLLGTPDPTPIKVAATVFLAESQKQRKPVEALVEASIRAFFDSKPPAKKRQFWLKNWAEDPLGQLAEADTDLAEAEKRRERAMQGVAA